MVRFFTAAYLLFSTIPVSAAPIQVDLELVLAIDTSSSVSPEEYRLQVQGLAMAFRDPTVLAAIRGIGNQGIAVTLVQWAKGSEQVQALPWARVRNREQAEMTACLERHPELTVGQVAKIVPFQREADLTRYVDLLRQAGLPDE